MNLPKTVRDVVVACCSLLIGASAGFGQDTRQLPSAPTAIPMAPAKIGGDSAPSSFQFDEAAPAGPGVFDAGNYNDNPLSGNHNFDRFIGFISNPAQSIDPRAITTIFPIFGSSWVSGNSPILPDANAQVYGAGLSVALSDRFSLGLTQGGYGVLDINGNLARILAARGLPVPERDIGGQRQGWLDLGGYLQYTLIDNAQAQFIVTPGLRWEAPSGATQLFQGGANPAYLAPYVTVGKAFDCWHVLGVGGFEFPAGEGTATTDTFYLNLHIDRQIGWLYPLVEFNGECHTRTVDLSLPVRHDVLDLGTFQSSGNLLTIAVGANAVLVPNKLEFGAVYETPIASQGHFDFNGVIVKMVYRF